MNKVVNEKELEIDFQPSKDNVSEILFSTGTTGKEKGIIITHENDLALAENVIDGVKMKEDNVELIPSPLNHSHGLRRVYANMYNGSSVVILSSVINIRLLFIQMDKYSVNSIDLVPSALSAILKLSKDYIARYKDQLRYIQYGSAPLNEDDKKRICELLPNTRMFNIYGSTESGCSCIYDFNDVKIKDKCIGKPTINSKLVMMNDKQEIIESSIDNTGYIACVGKMNTCGYLNDEEETSKLFCREYIITKDEAYYDEDGDIILLGRKDDVINIGGNKVAPDEIEDIARTYKDIEDCCCVPMKDAAYGAVPKLFVKIKKNHGLDLKEFNNFMNDRLEPFKVPKVVEEINVIPRTFNGKLQRNKLKEK